MAFKLIRFWRNVVRYVPFFCLVLGAAVTAATITFRRRNFRWTAAAAVWWTDGCQLRWSCEKIGETDCQIIQSTNWRARERSGGMGIWRSKVRTVATTEVATVEGNGEEAGATRTVSLQSHDGSGFSLGFLLGRNSNSCIKIRITSHYNKSLSLVYEFISVLWGNCKWLFLFLVVLVVAAVSHSGYNRL